MYLEGYTVRERQGKERGEEREREQERGGDR